MGEAKANSALLKGEHTLVKKKNSSKVGGLMAFARKRSSCLGCKASLPHDGAVCKHCEERESQIYQKENSKLFTLEEKFSKLWTQCQRCQGSHHEEVICSNRDCSIFYRRKKTQMDLDKQAVVMERFGIEDW